MQRANLINKTFPILPTKKFAKISFCQAFRHEIKSKKKKKFFRFWNILSFSPITLKLIYKKLSQTFLLLLLSLLSRTNEITV